MWNAFMNGSGMPGGGAGYVPSQGWEFVPCSGMDRAERGRGKSRHPARRISSPPAVFRHTDDPPAGGEAGAGSQLELLRAHMWPGAEAPQQAHVTRLKKKLEDLKKRHDRDKEDWMREKEALLREVADIQGGENRRMLLELKSVLEEVQVKREEEEKRSELQSTREHCSWELEKAELKRRIAQLEAREGAAVQLAAGPGSVALQRGETASLRREREEQRRLLADTHATATELRRRLDLDEREKAELLERFDVERRAWQSQLDDMQSQIEELYCDLKVGGRRLGDLRGLRSDEPLGPPGPSGALGAADARRAGCVRADGLRGHGGGGPVPQSERLRPPDQGGSTRRRAADTGEPDGVRDGAPQRTRLPPEDGTSAGKKTSGAAALDAALKEIARVSEELCSYQEEMRPKRTRSEPVGVACGPTRPRRRDAPCDFSQIYEDLRALERESRSEAPPLPPRSSSCSLSSSTDTELHIPESPLMADRKCHSPSVVRKFEALLQENEGKLLVDGVVAPPASPAGQNQGRWSCDPSRFAGSTLRKSFSEVNILTSASRPELPVPPLDVLLSSLDIGAALLGSRRNITLEHQTAQFNRTLFQAEPLGAARSGVTSSLSSIQNPEVQSRRMRCGAEGQEVRGKPGIPFDLSSGQPPTGLMETTTTTTTTSSQRSEADVQVASGTALPGQSGDGSSSVSLPPLSGESQRRQAAPLPSSSDSSRTGPRVMSDHPWKALTLAAYPRPEGSRSNYGAVERILKNYDSAARAHQNRPNEADSSPTELDLPDIDPLPIPRALRPATQLRATLEEEVHLTEEGDAVTSFSRPAPPANRRLPSRWAAALPPGPPPPTAPAVPP